MKKGIMALVVSLFLGASQSYALIDGQLLIGQRTLKVKSSGASSSESEKGQELKIAVHLDPIPLIPIGFGAYMSNTSFDGDRLKGQGGEIGLEVMAWLPIDLFNVTPYAKLGYTFMGAYAFDVESTTTPTYSYKSVYSPKGTRMALGLKWSPIPLVGVLLEYEQSNITLGFDEVKELTGLSEVPQDDVDLDGTGILLGVEVGI